MAKTIFFDEHARESLRNGIAKLASAVRITFGPRGRNVIFEGPSGSPFVTRDGVTVVNQIELEDVFENIGARIIRDVANRTSDRAGDGTTTATILAEAIFSQGLKAVVAGVSPLVLSRGIRRAADDICSRLETMSTPVRGSEMLARLTAIACNQDVELGRLIADVLDRLGSDGIVTVEEGHGGRTHVEWIEGRRLDRGHLSPYFVTEPSTGKCVLDEPVLLIANQQITSAEAIHPLLERCAEAGRPLLIVAEKVGGTALSTLVVNHVRGRVACCAVEHGEFGDHRHAALEDLAIATGGRVTDEQTGQLLAGVGLAELGQAKQAIVDKDATLVIGGAGRSAEMELRIERVRSELRDAPRGPDRDRLERRLGRLTGRGARLVLGAVTEAELQDRKARVENGLHAARAALAEGILPGGGVALVRASTALEARLSDSIEELGYRMVLQACRAPLIALVRNAGQNGKIVCQRVAEGKGGFGYNAMTGEYEDLLKAGIADPTLVTKSAVQNAASAAALLLTSDVLIAETPEAGATSNGWLQKRS
ncbi:MAG: chaperonin GroEL [Planctomycetales bacterium]